MEDTGHIFVAISEYLNFTIKLQTVGHAAIKIPTFSHKIKLDNQIFSLNSVASPLKNIYAKLKTKSKSPAPLIRSNDSKHLFRRFSFHEIL